MAKKQAQELYEITEKEYNHSLNMMAELEKIDSDNETLKLAKTYLSNHIDNCKNILALIEQMEYMFIKGKEVVVPYELQDDDSNGVMNW